MSETTIYESMRVDILSGKFRGMRGTVKRMNAARTRVYVKADGRIIRVHVFNVAKVLY